MNTYDYMSLVSGYIINRFESKKDMNESVVVNIKPVRDLYSNDLFYEISEEVNYKNKVFYLNFQCPQKELFYSAVRSTIIEYFNNSDILAYTSTSEDNTKKFTIAAKNRAYLNFFLEDETDELVFGQFKEYLDLNLRNKYVEDKKEEPTKISVKTLKKVQQVQN